MIAIGDSSDWPLLSALYAVAFIVAFIVALFTCVCNPRSRIPVPKSKRFNNKQKFVLSHDLPNDVPPNADLSQAQCGHPAQSCEGDSCNKLKGISLNRALPDIPQVPGTSSNSHQADAPFSNSTSFGDVISDDVDSLYTVANINAAANSQNHPYARIRNNVLVDSSTENDTDDYSESRMPAISAVQCHHHHENSQFRAVNINESNNAYELEPQSHILRLQLRNNIEPPLFSNNETDEKKEISYNTISVREPLSKVLAERENIEHHYNEVEEEERVSSFYEEITTGSATYSKINDVSQNKSGYGEPVASTSHHNHELMRNTKLPTTSSSSIEPNGPVYSYVDKKMKRANLQATTSAQLEANNLYTMVVKSPAKSANLVDPKLPILQRYSPPPNNLAASGHSPVSGGSNSTGLPLRSFIFDSPPPPLPPPLPRDTQPKLYRNTIMFGTPSNATSSLNHPQNYHSLSNELEQQNIYHKISRVGSEKDPGYETVDRNEKGDPNQPDYGYEAIMMDEIDPEYEIVKPESNTSDDNPAYETIKNETYNHHYIEEQIDPNYEIIASTSAQTRMTFHLAGGSAGHSSTEYGNNVDYVHSPTTVIIDENVIIEHL